MTEKDKQYLDSLNQTLLDFLTGKYQPVSVSALPEPESVELQETRRLIAEVANQYNEGASFVVALSKGNLEAPGPRNNLFLAPFKELHASLLHLTWQIRQISEGDLEQQVSFSGDFSDSINKMIDSLREKKKISELNEEYTAKLLELNAGKDKLFSIIAHDLKNPFSGLLNLSDLLLEETKRLQDPLLTEYATLISSFTQQGYRLLTNLLDWARLQTSSMQINPVELNLRELVDASLSPVLPSANRKGVQVQTDVDAATMVLADSNMLQVVLRNLLSNAVKYTSSGEWVRVKAVSVKEGVRIFVQDSGVGISPETRSRLFNIETTLSTNGTANETGTGLGLIICRDFLRKMNSEIHIQSVPGEGTEISFVLPETKSTKSY